MSINAGELLLNDEQDEGQKIRPSNLDEFVGQKNVVDNLQISLKAAQIRKEPLDHVLFSGPPGLGKTTLARILADSQKGNFHQVSAPNLKRPGDLAKILTALGENDTLFIDEIHRLTAPVEEVLYSAMEDRSIDITLAEGMGASSVQIDLPPFTLVGATTKPGSLTGPLRDRFGIHLRLEFYETGDLFKILRRSASIWKIDIVDDSLQVIAERSRRTPRVALHLLRRIWDFALATRPISRNESSIERETVIAGFQKMGIDTLGLTRQDIQFLTTIAENYSGGPVGLKPLSAVLAEDLVTLEDVIEPYLVRIAFVKRTARGRVLGRKAYGHLNLKITDQQSSLFDD